MVYLICTHEHQGSKHTCEQKMVRDFPSMVNKTEICTYYLVGKQHKNLIPEQETWRSSIKLELAYSYICGSIKLESLRGNMYLITFTDDFIIKTCIYFMKENSVAFDVFKRFKELVERESSYLIHFLRTDRGREFTPNAFNDFCSLQWFK